MGERSLTRKYIRNQHDFAGTNLIGLPDYCFYPASDIALTVELEGNLHVYQAIGNGTLPVEIYTRVVKVKRGDENLEGIGRVIDVVYEEGVSEDARLDLKQKVRTLATYIKSDPGYKLFESVLMQRKVNIPELRAIFGDAKIVDVCVNNDALVNGDFIEAMGCLYNRAVCRYKEEHDTIQLPLKYMSDENWI